MKDGSAEHVSREPEVIRAFRDTWKDGVNTYLSYLRDRLTVARDLLTESGSIFVQIGDENVHRVRALMDEVFGEKNFISLIVTQTSGGSTGSYLPGACDFIIWYAKDVERIKFRTLMVEKALGGDGASKYSKARTARLESRTLSADERDNIAPVPNGDRIYRQDNLTSQSVGRDKGEGASSWFGVQLDGVITKPSLRVRWKTNKLGMSRLIKALRVERTGNSLSYVRFLDDYSAITLNNVWSDIGGVQSRSDPKVYVVQSPVTLIQRCILMATDPGDLVLDPTCGSGTTAYVAEQWGRRWITIDTSRVALALARARLMGARYPFYLLRDSEAGLAKEAEITGTLPQSDRLAEVRHEKHKPDVSLGFVYRRVPHIQLKDIASNTEIDLIWEKLNPAVEAALEALNSSLKGHPEPFSVTMGGRAGTTIDFNATGEIELSSGEPVPADGFMEWEVPREVPKSWPAAAKAALDVFWDVRIARQREIDISIEREGNRNAEYLYDKPYSDPKTARVAGPFTVESLSPYRVIPSEDDPRILDMLRDEEEELPRRMVPKEQTDFAQVVMEHLKTAGVQNTKKGERLEFESIEPWPGKGYVAFEGRYEERGATRRAAIAIGPEYDAVGYEFVRNAAREARDAFDILIVCGFQFAPEVDDSMLNFGRLKVLKARMNQDIRMGDKLKNTGAGNLFVVFGEPDIEVREADDGNVQVEIKGVDIFDPTTGEVKSSDNPADDIACWFIDDDYDEESFFVKQAYFLGGAAGDPYKALKRSLKADIDEEIWTSLRRTVSHSFPRPESGRICVKVINHFGDEVQKVFRV